MIFQKGIYVHMERECNKYCNYVQILKEELLPAMGCTEPIALAYAAAVARKALGQMPDKVVVAASGSPKHRPFKGHSCGCCSGDRGRESGKGAGGHSRGLAGADDTDERIYERTGDLGRTPGSGD